MKHNILSQLIPNLWQSVVVAKDPTMQSTLDDLQISITPGISILVPKTPFVSKENGSLNDAIKLCIPLLLNYLANNKPQRCVIALPFENNAEEWALLTLYVDLKDPKSMSLHVYDPACVMDVQDIIDVGRKFTQLKINCSHHVAVTHATKDSGILVLFLLSQIMRSGRCGIPTGHQYLEPMMRYIAKHIQRLLPEFAPFITRTEMPITTAQLLTLDTLITYRQFMPKAQFEEFVRLAKAFYKANGIDDHDLKVDHELYKAGSKMKAWFTSPKPELILHNELCRALVRFDNDGDIVWVNSPDFDARQRLVDLLRMWNNPVPLAKKTIQRPALPRLTVDVAPEQREVDSNGYSFKGTVTSTAISCKFVQGKEILRFPENVVYESLSGKPRSSFEGEFTDDGKVRARGTEINTIPDFPIQTEFVGAYKEGKPYTGTITCLVGMQIDDYEDDLYLVYQGPILEGVPHGNGSLKAVCKGSVIELITGTFVNGALPANYETQPKLSALSANHRSILAAHYYVNIYNLSMHLVSHVENTLLIMRSNAQQEMFLQDLRQSSGDAFMPAYAASRTPLGDDGWAAVGAPARSNSADSNISLEYPFDF